MRFTPYEYQERAIRFVEDHPRCCLFLDMGLGKTVATLTAIQHLLDWCEISRVLVIAPKKVAEATWSTEAAKWDHLTGMRVVKVMGTEKQRRTALHEDADVYVMGRDSMVWLATECKGRLPFDMVVIDELTSFKTPRSQRFKAFKLSTAQISRIVGLTGTPAPNGLVDLWAQIYCIDRGQRLGQSVTRYRDQYFTAYIWNNIPIRLTPKKGAEEEIRAKIADICLTMQAKDYLQLPDCRVVDVPVHLSDKVMKGYRDFERERVLELKQTVNGDEPTTILVNSAAAMMNKLSQYANGAVYDAERNVQPIHEEKSERLAELMEEANGEHLLVFYTYKHDLPRIRKVLKGYRVETYEDEDTLKRWNAGEIDVLLAHPASCAYGLNMQFGGHYIVWYGAEWNLELYQQANARLHRQGQKHPVTVYRLVCSGTVDEKAASALDGKKTQQQTLLDGLKELMRKYE